MSNTNTPFVNGNKWRFTDENQPKRQMTVIQLRKRLESLLYLCSSELIEAAANKDNPVVIRNSAQQIINGDANKVVELINSLNNGRKGKKA